MEKALIALMQKESLLPDENTSRISQNVDFVESEMCFPITHYFCTL